MLRSVLSVVAGSVIWTILWFALNAALGGVVAEESADASIDSLSLLSMLIVGSTLFSVVGGYVTALLAKTDQMKHVVALGILQLLLGIFFEALSWALLPLWYHLVFLALLIPGNLAGGWLRMRGKG